MVPIRRLRDSLIFVEDVRAAGADPRELQRECRRGLFTRVRRGVYMNRELWESLDPTDRHLAQVIVVAREARPPFLIAGSSAGAVWRLPFAAAWPDDVTTLIRHDRGGKSEPGVRRTVASAGAARGVERDGIPVTSLARTALDVARTLPFPRAVAVVDRAISVKNPDAVTVAELRETLAAAAYTRRAGHLARVVEFADPLAESPYESMARALMHELGFSAPVLQKRYEDRDGAMYPDFCWPEHGIGAEFDGKMKYTRDEFTGGDPAEVVFREKQREDRLRRFLPRIVRILARHVHHPLELAALLDDAGVPRERPRSVASDPVGSGSLAPVLEQWP